MDSAGHVVYNHQLQIRYRALDLLAEWIDGYYFYDFKDNLELVKELLVFVRDEVNQNKSMLRGYRISVCVPFPTLVAKEFMDLISLLLTGLPFHSQE